jgi:hypothetical protein
MIPEARINLQKSEERMANVRQSQQIISAI